MKLFTRFPALSLFASGALVQAAQEPCSGNATLPCACPAGTQYVESGTWVILGTGISDVRALMTDFYDTAWRGALPIATHGPDNTAGSTRTFNYSTPVGNYNITEVLTAYLVAESGSFRMLYEQVAPVKYNSGKGEFAGYWVTFQFDATFPTQTPMGWTSYSCQTGYPFDFAAYRTAAIRNATSIFEKAGKQPGKLLGPLSEQSSYAQKGIE